MTAAIFSGGALMAAVRWTWNVSGFVAASTSVVTSSTAITAATINKILSMTDS